MEIAEVLISEGDSGLVISTPIENTDLVRIDETANYKRTSTDPVLMCGLDNSAGTYAEISKGHKDINLDIDVKSSQVMAVRVKDSGSSVYAYQVKVLIVYEEDKPLSYQEAKDLQEIQKQAVEVVIN